MPPGDGRRRLTTPSRSAVRPGNNPWTRSPSWAGSEKHRVRLAGAARGDDAVGPARSVLIDTPGGAPPIASHGYCAVLALARRVTRTAGPHEPRTDGRHQDLVAISSRRTSVAQHGNRPAGGPHGWRAHRLQCARCMAPRAIWTGAITFGLVSVPVGLHSAVERSKELHFRLLHEKDNSPIDYRRCRCAASRSRSCPCARPARPRSCYPSSWSVLRLRLWSPRSRWRSIREHTG
jgi:hypothetical protein